MHFQDDPLRHPLSLEFNLTSWLVERLLHLEHCFDYHRLKVGVLLLVFLIEGVNQVIKLGTQTSGQSESFIQFIACRDVVILLIVEFDVHVQIEQFLHFYFIVPIAQFCDSVVLNSDIHICQLIIVSLVQVAQSHPLIYKSQGHIRILIFIL